MISIKILQSQQIALHNMLNRLSAENSKLNAHTISNIEFDLIDIRDEIALRDEIDSNSSCVTLVF